MIVIANINDVNLNDFDEVYVCMRSVDTISNNIIYSKNVFHLPELSPSKELFLWHHNLKKNFQWTEKVFKEQYVPKFLNEMKSEEAIKAMNHLIKRSNEGLKLAVCCSCARQDLCHRSILAALLRRNGTSEGTFVTDFIFYDRPLVKYDHFYEWYKNEGLQ